MLIKSDASGSEDVDLNELKSWLKERNDKDAVLYEQYGRPLEPDHKGEFIAISDDGEVILGLDKLRVDLEALARFGSGNYAFRRIGFTFEASWRRAP